MKRKRSNRLLPCTDMFCATLTKDKNLGIVKMDSTPRPLKKRRGKK